jgi:beta-phosphoglucomutase
MKLKLESIKAVIFDMDGTMVNNMGYHKKAWIQFAKNHEVKLSDKDFKEKVSGRKNDKIFELLFDKPLSKTKVKEFTEEKEEIYRKIYAPFVKEIKGLKKILKNLRI